jgi:mRNA interferase MazF
VTFRRWDLVSVPFPYVEGHDIKRRPALIVSTDASHAARDASFAAMVTTVRGMRDVRQDDIVIGDCRRAGLPAPRVIRLSRLATFEAAPAIRRVGSLAAKERNAVAALLKRWLG